MSEFKVGDVVYCISNKLHVIKRTIFECRPTTFMIDEIIGLVEVGKTDIFKTKRDAELELIKRKI